MSSWNPFRRPSPLRLAAEELEDAKRSLLEASSASEYAEAMVLYHTRRIERLGEMIAELAAEPAIPVPKRDESLGVVDWAPGTGM